MSTQEAKGPRRSDLPVNGVDIDAATSIAGQLHEARKAHTIGVKRPGLSAAEVMETSRTAP